MNTHDFDFDDSMTIIQFYKKNRVSKGNRKFLIKVCTAESGDNFISVGFADGDTLKDGRPSYRWFVASRALEASTDLSSKEKFRQFLKEHKEDLMLLEPPLDEDGNPELKFGICFLAGGAEDFDEL